MSCRVDRNYRVTRQRLESPELFQSRYEDPLHRSEMAWDDGKARSKVAPTNAINVSSRNGKGNAPSPQGGAGDGASGGAEKPQSFASILQEFAGDSTVHGVSKAASASIYTGRRLLWTVLVLAGASALVSFTVFEVQNFLARDTIVTSQNILSLELPVITLCPLKSFDGTVTKLEEVVNTVGGTVPSVLGTSGGSTTGSGASSATSAGIGGILGGVSSAGTSVLTDPTLPSVSLDPTTLVTSVTDTLNSVIDAVTGLLKLEDVVLTKLRYPPSYISQTSIMTAHLSLFGTEGSLPSSYSEPDSGESLRNWTMDSKVLQLTNCPVQDGNFQKLSCCDDVAKDTLTEIGKCMTIDPKTYMTDTAAATYAVKEQKIILSLSLTQPLDFLLMNLAGLQMIVHDPEEDPLPSKRGVFVPANALTTILVRRSQRVALPTPFKSFSGIQCTETDEEDFKKKKNPVKRYGGPYRMETCMQECMVNHTVEVCGCRHPWFPELPGDTSERICTIAEVADCVWEEQANFNDTSSATNCTCPTPCLSKGYEVNVMPDQSPSVTFKGLNLDSVSTDGAVTCHDKAQGLLDEEKLLVIDIRLPYEVDEIRQVPKVTISELFASIGGIIGLLMGFSVLSLAEIVELAFLILRFWISKMVCRRKN